MSEFTLKQLHEDMKHSRDERSINERKEEALTKTEGKACIGSHARILVGMHKNLRAEVIQYDPVTSWYRLRIMGTDYITHRRTRDEFTLEEL